MNMAVTPELRQWIIEQSSAGCLPEAVLDAGTYTLVATTQEGCTDTALVTLAEDA